ncbi:MAG: hypothetical protein ACOH12_14920 [Parvibaculaceae bacterium]
MSRDTHDHGPALSRRNILILGGVAIAAGALPLAFPRLEPDNHALVGALTSLIVDMDAAARLGREWRLKSAGPKEPHVIAAAIGKRLVTHGWTDRGSPDELRFALRDRIRQDYASNDMVSIGGWQIARISAELCALAASLTEAPEHG